MAQIIPKNPVTVEDNWQKELAQAFTAPESLLTFLQLPHDSLGKHGEARRLFPMRVPRPFAERMVKGDAHDPLFRQVFPNLHEFEAQPGFVADPLGEQTSARPGILHKYQSRVLLIVRGGCAVNCRYCFRRHFPYQDNSLNKTDWQEALDYVRSDSNINEVIYSGGDPLMANDQHLDWLTTQIEQIPHIKRLRIHTRLPVVIPSRITNQFCQRLAQSRLAVVMVVHINHAQEIDAALADKLQQLRSAGVTLLNQAVLLEGVNDTVDAQCDLGEALFDAGVLPYYLHLLDKVEGAAHFDVSVKRAREIMAEMIKRQPGFLVPKLVREIADQPGKTPIDLHLYPQSGERINI